MIHDQWSKLGERALGSLNIDWAERVGPMVLMKAILNAYWADVAPSTREAEWDRVRVDMVMSKLYWCWVAEMDRQDRVRRGEDA